MWKPAYSHIVSIAEAQPLCTLRPHPSWPRSLGTNRGATSQRAPNSPDCNWVLLSHKKKSNRSHLNHWGLLTMSGSTCAHYLLGLKAGPEAQCPEQVLGGESLPSSMEQVTRLPLEGWASPWKCPFYCVHLLAPCLKSSACCLAWPPEPKTLIRKHSSSEQILRRGPLACFIPSQVATGGSRLKETPAPDSAKALDTF